MSTSTKKPPVVANVPKRVNYHNYQLWRLLPTTETQVQFLMDYRSTVEGAKLQWWKGPTLRFVLINHKDEVNIYVYIKISCFFNSGPTDIAVPPSIYAEVKESLDYEDIPYDVIIWDLEKAIQFANPRTTKRQRIENQLLVGHPLTWYRYHRYADITKFLDHLQRKYSRAVELIDIGRSFEGRPLMVAKVLRVLMEP